MTATNSSYSADITWTTHGVAHIAAQSWGDLGFGQGFACARDHLGILVDQAVKVRSQRSLFHGRGPSDSFLASDFGYLALDMTGRAARLRDSLSPEIRALTSGYVAGHNAYLAEAQATGAVPEWCRDAAWLSPIDELDYFRFLVDVLILASGRSLIGLIGRAEAPGPNGPVEPSPLAALSSMIQPAEGAGSNGWAFGSEATASGGGLVVANPHFPWNGESRFWECHLTLTPPGQSEPVLDAYGTSLVGVPSIQIGFNRDVAWTHTVSKGHRFTLSQLTLVEGNPTTYRFGEGQRDMTPQTHQVEVKDEGLVERTLWSSHQGPMLNMPILGWGTEIGFTYRDANIDNLTAFPTWIDLVKAKSIDDFKTAFARHQGIPWVNTLAADSSGRAWYIDGSATPNLSAAAQQRFRERLDQNPIAALLFQNRAALFDGSDPDDEWLVVDGARDPGLVPFANQPQLERRDFLINANDSYWLTNHRVPMAELGVLHGLHGVAPSQRTRLNLVMAAELADQGGLSIDAALDAMVNNRSITAERLLPQVMERMRSAGLNRVAQVLEDWDGRYELDSQGAILWRELMAGFTTTDLIDHGGLYADHFDPSNPLDSPSQLWPAPEDPATDPLVVAAQHGVDLLAMAGLPVDAALGQVQYANRGGQRIPIHGGGEADGVININTPVSTVAPSTVQPKVENPQFVAERAARTGLANQGYSVVYGASIVLAVDLGGADGPVAKGLLAYGQSSDPNNTNAATQTQAFSAKSWRSIAFSPADIAADPAATQRRVTN